MRTREFPEFAIGGALVFYARVGPISLMTTHALGGSRSRPNDQELNARRALPSSERDGKPKRDTRSLTDLTQDLKRPAMIRNDAMGDTQAQPGAALRQTRRVEGISDLLQVGVLDPATVVPDNDFGRLVANEDFENDDGIFIV